MSLSYIRRRHNEGSWEPVRGVEKPDVCPCKDYRKIKIENRKKYLTKY
jgi:hypothetical protein